MILGTAGYMSPEQVRGQPLDHRSDIFSFGAMLYEMVSGERAFKGDSAVETMSAILKHDPPLLSADRRGDPAAAGQRHPALSREGARSALPVGAGSGVRPQPADSGTSVLER